MNETTVKMDLYGGALLVGIQLWSRTENIYRWAYLTFDTGASVTTLSPEILYELGYEPVNDTKVLMTTASGVEKVSCFKLDKLKINDIEINDVNVYAHKFLEECFSLGVIGLNVLQNFDIDLIFSKRIIRLKKIDL